MSTPNCAGQFLDRGFMFHSGHFQPTLQEGLAFFCQFVRNSCANLTGRARDDLVNQLARLTLDYYDYYEGPVHSTSLKILARKYRRTSETEVTSPRISGTSPISIQGSRSEPRPIGGFPKSSPISVKQVKPTVGTALSGSPKDEILTAERIQPTRPRTPSISNFFETGRTEKRALWMPDSTRKTCTICNSTFTFINRKHHCRRCGNLVCDSCSTARRVVKLPAVEKPSEAVAVSNGAVRVCDSCKDLRDL